MQRKKNALVLTIKSLCFTFIITATSIVANLGMPIANAQNTWAYTSSMNMPRYNFASTLLQNGKVLVRGSGDLNGGITSTNAEVYDPSTVTWSYTGPTAVPINNGGTATLLPNGQVLTAGGGAYNQNFNSTDSELYNPATNSWSSTPGGLNVPREDATATLLPNGKVLIAGGLNLDSNNIPENLNSAELYDPSTGTWSMTGSMNVPRSFHRAVLLPSGDVLVSGGEDNNNTILKSAELYDPSTGAWSLTGNMNLDRQDFFLTMLPNGKVLAAGGFYLDTSSSAVTTTPTAEIYNPGTDTWSYTGNMTVARAVFSGTNLPDGRTLVTGGYGLVKIHNKLTTAGLSSTEEYDPYTGTWTALASMNAVRRDHATILLPNGNVLVAGGYDANQQIILSSAEIFNPIVHPKLFILIQGIDSSLSSTNISQQVTPGFDTIKSTIKGEFPNAQFLTYSYAGPKSKNNATPQPYTCAFTLENPLSTDIQLLDKQIQAALASQPNADIYLVAHSMGGIVAYGYLAALEETTGIVTPLPQANLKGVITLDSPLGGISSNSTYFSNAITFYEANCPGFNSQIPTALLNMSTIFDSTTLSTPPDSSAPDPQGAQASILSIPFSRVTIPQPYPSNQKVAEDAQLKGVSLLSVGNTNDLLWMPSTCFANQQDFTSTQWLEDEGSGSGIYGRDFTSGSLNCFLGGVLSQANHMDVLTDSNVMQGIQEFINYGATPTSLFVAPPGPD